ncbi:MAG: PAS domain-containing sensor histidine kinase [Melioribacter sp.]|uniref:PAS domain-containing sensor histidine kinase n=1 Tax=Rosettibacter primus TaxID=3111523 RepID=UPI00247BDC3A|nr:PAS domain-containing sensor histidine kinase [Melioribacter sp.]
MQKNKKEIPLLNTDGTIYDKKIFPHRHVPKEQLYKIIAEFSIDWIYWLNPHNKISYISPSCRYITGYSPEEFIEEQSLLIKIIAPEDRDRFILHTREVIRGKIFCTEEFKIITKNGEERWIAHACQAVYDDKNKYIGRYISNRDVTDIKLACEKIEETKNLILEIYNDASIGTYQIFPDGKIKSANATLIKMLGYNNFPELQIVNFDETIIINKEKRNWLKSILNVKGVIKDFESDWLRKDGTVIHVREQTKAVKDSNGNIIYYEGIVQNITEKKKAEELLIETEIKNKKLENLKAEFLATISHEIRTPINIIVNLSQMLKNDLDKSKNEELIESTHIIENESLRIQRTIDLILEIAQLTADTYDSKPEVLNLYNDILKDMIEKYQPIANKKGLDFLFVSNCENPLILADKHSCKQIFSQLIENAIKYTSEGRVEVLFYNNSKEEPTIEIKDTGIGIDKEFIPYLFSTFSQEDNSYSRMFEGTGLGLAIVKKHCDLNNAEINVRSKKGFGSSFIVTFKKKSNSLI